MKTSAETAAWRQYEAGRNFKRRIGLYETVRVNERFYRGDQWQGVGNSDLPRPVFNIVRRIADYLICNVASADLKITYSDENLPAASDEKEAEYISEGIEVLSRSAAYRWEHEHLQTLIYRLLSDAAISGDGALYCWWDADADSGTGNGGDIVTEAIDNVNLFVSDPNRADIQSQEYIILSGRAPVRSLRDEARRCGVSEREIARILPDGKDGAAAQSGDGALNELEGSGDEKTTYLIKFWREDGYVRFEKSTRECVIRRVKTPCRLYPVAYFNWYPTKNCFHGTSPITGLIPNQKYINRAYAMVMKHMTDTAFSKVIYDRTRIPEWTNEVGEAIGAAGGGNISDAVAVVGTGQLENGYLDLISNAISVTKELAGATETALGNTAPNNASAILALREGATVALEQVKSSLHRCIEDMADIWADMSCAYYPDRHLLRTADGAEEINCAALRRALVRARVDVAESTRYSVSGTKEILDRLLDGGHITFCEYLERLPDGILPGRSALLEARKRKNTCAVSAGADAKEAPADANNE